MEQETFFSEKSSFANQNYKKYGTTNHNNMKRSQQSEALVRHDLSKSDTLQGIAIQYGCSVSGRFALTKAKIQSRDSNLVLQVAVVT